MTAFGFVQAQLPKHDRVSSVEARDADILEVQRTGDLSPVLIGVSESRWLDASDLRPYLGSAVDGVVISGKHRHYTGGAWEDGQKAGVAVLTFGELLRALSETKLVDYEAADMRYLRTSLVQHSRVSSVERVCERQLLVTRDDLDPIVVIPVGIYTLGEADVVEVLAEHPDVDAIVNLGSYRHYTPEARRRARLSGKGLFSGAELFGALHREGSAFVDYEASADSD